MKGGKNIKENIFKENSINNIKEDNMGRKKKHEAENLASLIIGIILMAVGVVIFVLSLQIATTLGLIISSVIIMIIGAVLALLGGLRVW